MWRDKEDLEEKGGTYKVILMPNNEAQERILRCKFQKETHWAKMELF